jgi:mannosyltransferase
MFRSNREPVVTPSVSWRDLTRADLLGVAALMGLATALGILQLGTESLWLDESSSVAIASRAPAELWNHVTRVELNGSIYYLLLHEWMSLFGQSEAAIRGLSVIFSVAAVPFVYLTGRMLFDRRIAFAATLILVTSAFIVSYEQEARAYALALFLTSLATFLFAWGLRRPTWLAWLLYVAVAALSLYAHFYAAFVLAAHAISLLFIDRRTTRWRPILISFGLIGILALPVVRFALLVENAACRTAWVPPVDPGRLGVVLWELVGGNEWLLAAIGVAILVGLATVVLRRLDRDARWPVVFALLLVGVPLALSLIISVVRPLLATRYLIVVVPGLAYLVAYGLYGLRWRQLGAVALVGVIALSSWSLASYYLEPRKADFRDVAQVVTTVSDSSDAAIVYQRYGEPSHLLTYYLDQMAAPASRPAVVELPVPTDYPLASSVEDCPTTPNDAYRDAIADAVAQLSRSHDRVVVVIRQASEDQFLPVLITALETRYEEVERVFWFGTRWYPGTELRVYDALDATAGASQ